MKIGLLISKSIIYPEISFDFTNGLRLATSNNKNLEFVIESIDFGAKESIITEKAQKILFEHQLHGIIALGGQLVTKTLTGVASVSKIPIIIADTGGDIYTQNENPLVFINSLEIWKSALLLGDYVKKNGHKNVGIVSSFYDSGYKMIHAFTEGLGFPQVFTYVTAYDQVPQEAKEVESQIIKHKPDALFGVLSHEYASRFLKYYVNMDSEKSCKLYATATMCYENVLEKVNSDLKITSATSWSINLDNKENKEFTTAYLEKTYKNASLFSLLGFECGKALSIAEAKLTAPNPSPKMLAEALKEIEFEGPRSKFNFKGDLQNHIPKHWLTEINYKDKKYTIKIIEELTADSEKEMALFDNTDELHDSGWSNPYLCI